MDVIRKTAALASFGLAALASTALAAPFKVPAIDGTVRVNGVPLSAAVAVAGSAVPAAPDVFIGAVASPDNLSNSQAVSSLVASGRVGVYWHFSGLFGQIQDGTDEAASAIWNPLGAAVGELPYTTSIPESDTVITVANSTGAALNLAAGIAVSDTTGGTWQVVYPNLLIALDGRPQSCMDPVNEVYTIPAGGSCLIDVQSNAVGATTIAANALTAFAPAISGLSITASDAVLAAGATQAAGTYYGRVGQAPDGNSFFTRTDGGGFTSLLTGRNHPTTEADINVDYQTSHTAEDVTVWKSYVDAARRVGVQSVAPIVQPDQSYNNAGGGGNFVNAFNTTYQQMALYGGAISFDEPPNHALSYGYGYVQWLESAILWARANNIRSSWIISPDAYAQATFVEDLHRLVSILQHDNALPTQWVVENYRTQCGATTVGNDTTKATQTTPVSAACPSGAPAVPYTESLNAAALYLADMIGTAPAATPETGLITSTPAPQALYHPAGHAGAQINLSDIHDGYHVLTDARVNTGLGVLGLDWMGNIPGGLTMAMPTTTGFNTAGVGLTLSGKAAVGLDLSGLTAAQTTVKLGNGASFTWIGAGASPVNSAMLSNNGLFSWYGGGSSPSMTLDPQGDLSPAGVMSAAHGIQMPLVAGVPASATPTYTGIASGVVDGADSKVCFYIAAAWKCATLQ